MRRRIISLLIPMFFLAVLMMPSSQAGWSGDLNAEAGTGYVDLSWRTNDTAIHYCVYRGSGADDMKLIENVTAPITAYHDGDLEEGATFIYYVTAVDATGESDPSDSVSVTILKSDGDNSLLSVLAIVLSAIALQASVIVLLYLFRMRMK